MRILPRRLSIGPVGSWAWLLVPYTSLYGDIFSGRKKGWEGGIITVVLKNCFIKQFQTTENNDSLELLFRDCAISQKIKTFIRSLSIIDIGLNQGRIIPKIYLNTRNTKVNVNVVPIGIINLDAILLKEEQVQENIKTKSEGKKVDASRYESV